jgi:hypothetical protein
VKKENPNVKNIKARLYCAGSKSDTPLHTVKLDSVKFVIFPAIPADGTACWISVEVRHFVSMFPDPDWIWIQSGQWIRIHILNPDPDSDPGGRIRMFLGLLDPDSLVRGMDPDPDHSIGQVCHLLPLWIL